MLRDLGVERNGKAGTAALPVALNGRLDLVNGFWTGSLIDPRIAGDMKATQVAVEMAPVSSQNSSHNSIIHLDSLEASGSYSAARIDFTRGLLRKDSTEVSFSGSLSAAAAPIVHGGAPVPSYDANSVLQLRLLASKVDLADVSFFTGQKLPMTGTLGAQLQLDGPIHALAGSGWVTGDKISLYGETMDRVRAQGTLSNQTLDLTSISVNGEGGRISATGSYNLKSGRCQVDATGADFNLARMEALRRQDLPDRGHAGFYDPGSLYAGRSTLGPPCRSRRLGAER